MRVLFADDDKVIAEASRRLLENAGHEALVACDGAEAVELAKSFRPAIVMLDIGMPRLTGFEAAIQIRAILPDVVLVAVSGWPVSGREAEFKAAGFDQAVLKPAGVIELCMNLISGTGRWQ